MSKEENIALATRFTQEAFNNGNLDVIDEILATDYVNHNSPPNLPRGPAGTKMFISMFRTGFPDLHITIEGVLEDDDYVAVRHVTTGTHTGTFLGIPPTGKQIRVQGIDWVRIEDARIIEGWGIVDMMGLMQQLGVVPSPQ